MKLDAHVVQGFVGSVLASRFDGQAASPPFHKECWELCTGPEKYVALAAPRNHAKSTAITLGYGLATLLFRERKFMLLVSDTESQSSLFLGLFKQELQDNKDLVDLFGIKRNDKGIVQFIKDSETDIVVECTDGHKFRVIAKGAEQKLRGLIWNGSRPDIIICHEEGTEIYTPETGWITNTEYPGATVVHAEEAYRITFDDGHTEVVSGDHRFLVESGWRYPWELKVGENVVENGIRTMLNPIPTKEQLLSWRITKSQRLKNALLHGMRRIVIESLLLEKSGTRTIKNVLLRLLGNMLRKILNGKLLTVLNADHVNSGPVLLGLPKNS
jgi:hypothetical protein